MGAQRLQNEAAAPKLLAKHTSLPVPRALSCKRDEQGAIQLEVERIDGIELDTVGKECRMTPGVGGHTDSGLCSRCAQIAFANATSLIIEKLLPQLASLTSSETEFSGFVIRPPRIAQYDDRHVWMLKQASSGSSFQFRHNDLSRFNILVDTHSLNVRSIIDWESAGYVTAELEQPLWNLSCDDYMEALRDTATIEEEISLIT